MTPTPTDQTEQLELSIVALDDDPDFREYIASLLESDGHRVRACASKSEFLDECERSRPDIALLDMKMGRESGQDVLATIRERWEKLCVIIITGYPSLESMRETFKQDVFDYIAKPFSIEDLRAALSQAAQQFDLGGRPQDKLRRELGRHIRLARTQRSWTLKDLSIASDISVSQLSSIERGAHLPSIESLLAVAHALETEPSEWLRAAGF